MDVEALVNRAKQGESEALVQLIMHQKSDYYKLAFTYMKNSEDAMDAMEDMIVILYENIYRLKKNEAFYSWSKTILVNCCKKHLRKRKNLVPINSLEEKTVEFDFSQNEDRILLNEHLAKLNEKHQEVLRLRYFLDLDYKSVADVLKVPVGTVKSRISNALRKLSDSLGGEI